ncbi:aminotransferase class I/II-fold pyridoxal phosphate-dependent enzyme [Bradyrhizobium sp. PUT101]|uniref:aminotransferase class I/II-fold pyridoxal phosphate-dependent enzyme n=1 Tax=Bradyrhizobium sp. PUT101 TaxID=3447427 RepID=UPI003F8704D1
MSRPYLCGVPNGALRTTSAELPSHFRSNLVRAGENVVVFRTFDKMFGLAGLGLGYAVAPPALATSLKRAGFGRVDALDRLALVAAAASMRDADYVATTRTKVAAERDKWHQLLTSLNLRHSGSRGNFIFFEADRPQTEIAAALRGRGIEIGRAFPPLKRWVRITIGLPHENAAARSAVAELLR